MEDKEKLSKAELDSMLNKEKIQTRLSGVDVITREITGSTNNDAKDMIKNKPGDTLIVAEEQTAGRGRRGKSFLSPNGGLYMTLLLRCSMPIKEALGATSCAAVALVRALDKLCRVDAKIKWVNDIYAGGKKLCGILTEAVNDYSSGTTEYLIIGIGVNVASSPDITSLSQGSAEAVSLSELGANVGREELCADITRELLQLRRVGFDFSSVYDEYLSRSAVMGREITFIKNGVAHRGKAIGIDKNGALAVESDGKCFILDSGEISVRLNQ